MHHEQHRDIGKEGERRPFEDCGVARIAKADFEDDAEDPEQQGIESGLASGEQGQRRTHRAEIGAEIDDIGDEQQRYHRPEQGA